MSAQKQFRILAVDEAFSVRRKLREELVKAHYAFEEAMHGEHALFRLRQMDIDLVVTELRMRRMSGIKLLREMRADDRLKHIPVVVFAAHDESGKEEALAAGANAYISKSDEDKYERLKEAIEELLLRPAP